MAEIEIDLDQKECGELLTMLDEWDARCQVDGDREQVRRIREVTRSIRARRPDADMVSRAPIPASAPLATPTTAVPWLGPPPGSEPKPARLAVPGRPPEDIRSTISVLVPQGIGDSVWATPKMEALAKQAGVEAIAVKVACWNANGVEHRALDFLSRFPFVASVQAYQMPRGSEAPLLKPGPRADKSGLYRYIDDGPHPELPGIDYVLIPNAPLERGTRLEDWLPDLATNWDAPASLAFTKAEEDAAARIATTDPYAVLFLSSLDGNWSAGHNMGGMWTPDQWVQLGEKLHADLGVSLVVVGAGWDSTYWTKLIEPAVKGLDHWCSLIGVLSVMQTLAVIKRARMMISYQSGLGVMSHYLGTPTAMWWRPDGKSIDPSFYVSPRQSMATAWTYPTWAEDGNFLPLIYGRESVGDIVSAIKERGW